MVPLHGSQHRGSVGIRTPGYRKQDQNKESNQVTAPLHCTRFGKKAPSSKMLISFTRLTTNVLYCPNSEGTPIWRTFASFIRSSAKPETRHPTTNNSTKAATDNSSPYSVDAPNRYQNRIVPFDRPMGIRGWTQWPPTLYTTTATPSTPHCKGISHRSDGNTSISRRPQWPNATRLGKKSSGRFGSPNLRSGPFSEGTP